MGDAHNLQQFKVVAGAQGLVERQGRKVAQVLLPAIPVQGDVGAVQDEVARAGQIVVGLTNQGWNSCNTRHVYCSGPPYSFSRPALRGQDKLLESISTLKDHTGTGLRLSGRGFLQYRQPNHQNTTLQLQGAGAQCVQELVVPQAGLWCRLMELTAST